MSQETKELDWKTRASWVCLMIVSVLLVVVGFRNYGITSLGRGVLAPYWWLGVGSLGLVGVFKLVRDGCLEHGILT